MSLFLEGNSYFKDFDIPLKERFFRMNWSFFLLICLIVSIGIVLLYSASGGSINPWAIRQFYRFLLGSVFFFAIALSDLRMWMRYAYILYFISLVALVLVEFKGAVGMGAQRWLNLGFFQFQPSELIKITLVLALARYFHGSTEEDVKKNTYLIVPALLLAFPVALILKQPDLGTATMLCIVTLCLFFLIGVQLWKFGLLILVGIASIPVVWHFLHDYQKSRVLTFLSPESDPLGKGYHIMQSKITLGSGGVFGKGFLQGTQSHLNFIPEKHTDFIFTVLSEEFGMIGSVTLLILYMSLIFLGFRMALRSANGFGKLLALGLTVNFATYVFINIAMVMGLLPVVGVPLPLVSYGGSAMMTLMIGFGFVECCYINREMVIGRLGSFDD